jgi:predicted dehydrogenase
MGSDLIRVAMIGCGGNARHHMSQLHKLDGVKIVGLCDPADAAIEATFAALPDLKGTPVFTDYQELLAEVGCDAVEISTPHTQHFDQIMASLDKGCHVQCEKPMVCTVPDAQEVIAKVKATGLVFGVAYQRHTQAPYRYCREAIASGDAGKVNFITALQSQNWYRGCVLSGMWRGKIALSGGGQLNDSGSHLLDIVLWMSGLQPSAVFAYQDNLGSEVDILTAMSVTFDGGAMASFSVVGHAVNWLEDITIWCEDMTLAIRGSEVWRWKKEGHEVVPASEMGASSYPDLNFVRSIRGEETPQATAEDALKVIQLSEAAWRSAEEAKPAAVVR